MMPTSARICHVCAAADSPPRFYPQIHVMQNALQCEEYTRWLTIPKFVCIPHWPQPDLLPRNVDRGSKFENIVYVGARDQLARELQGPEICEKLKTVGLSFKIMDSRFDDYSDIDCLVAIRSFDGNKYIHKPASKLVNAWTAGVPAIVGVDSSFSALRKSSLDYLEAATLQQFFDCVWHLKDRPALRAEMVRNGFARRTEFTEQMITDRWISLLTEEAPRIHKLWLSKGGTYKRLFHLDQFSHRMARSAAKRVRRLIGRTI